MAAVDGVAVAEGDVFGYAQLVGSDGEPVGEPGDGAADARRQLDRTDELNPFDLATRAAPPAADDEVVIDRKSADEAGYSASATRTTVLVQGGAPHRCTIAGIATLRRRRQPRRRLLRAVHPAAAQRLVAEPGKFDSIVRRRPRTVSPRRSSSRPARRQVLPDGRGGHRRRDHRGEPGRHPATALSFFNTFMLIFAVIALLVGAFMIFNTFSITVAQRTRENALLRALGASRRQVLGSVLLEALVVGVVASLVGPGRRVGVAAGLKALLAALRLRPPGRRRGLRASTR